jgi:hypothetical protein
MNFNERVTIQIALSAKRSEYISDWLLSYQQGGDIAFWSHRIERVNDAAETVAALPYVPWPCGWEVAQ